MTSSIFMTVLSERRGRARPDHDRWTLQAPVRPVAARLVAAVLAAAERDRAGLFRLELDRS